MIVAAVTRGYPKTPRINKTGLSSYFYPVNLAGINE